MIITKSEARASLDEVENIMARTRRAIACGCCSSMLILWGAIWIAGFSGTQFFPAQSGLIWLLGDSAGFIGSWILGRRSGSSVKSANGPRIAFSWMALFIYAGLWIFILHPSDLRFFGAYPATVAMFGYVVMGLWLDRFLLYIGVAVTVLTLAGILLVPEWFNLWMGLTGGGSLVLAGLHIRRNWS